MWAIKWFLAVVVILMVLGFALQNSAQTVDVVFLQGVWEFQQVQLWLVIYASFGLGVIFWLIVSVFQVLQLKNDMRRLQKQTQDMQHELDSLRNLPLSDDDVSFDIKEEA
ncbi:MAG: lipopolysaccharide assembly LapA domain-containing protein [bacterium]